MSAVLSKKVCLIGDFAVGKTSLVARFIHNVFSDKYLTTLGVKIDTKTVEPETGVSLKMIIWDIAGADRLSTADRNYLRGADAYLLVVDGTRRDTLIAALDLKQAVDRMLGDIPFVLLVNKSDLQSDWEITTQDIDLLKDRNWAVLTSSAMQGDNVELAFTLLAEELTKP